MFLLIYIKEKFSKIQDLTQSHLKSTLKKKLSICTLLESDNERLFKSIAHISCCCKRLSSSPIK